MRFDRFMERALYHPEYGYYRSEKPRLGREGDFFTSVSVGRSSGACSPGSFARCGSGWGSRLLSG